MTALPEPGPAILELENTWYRHPGAKDAAIRDRLRISPTRYHQLLAALLDNPAALAHNPVLVNRLRRLRDQRRLARSSVGAEAGR